jgi:uncharacterized protein (TIGR03086 family)
MDAYAAFEQAVASTAEVVMGVAADQLAAPTPCAEWDVRALLNHVIGTLWLSDALLTDAAPRHPMAPGGLPGADLAGTDPVAAYAEAAAAALAAASAGDALTRLHVTPMGDMPGPVLAGFTTLDIAVHGWDLARATGQPAALDAALAGHVLAFARQSLAGEPSRGGRIGPAVAVPAGAPVTDRLAAFLGRQP